MNPKGDFNEIVPQDEKPSNIWNIKRRWIYAWSTFSNNLFLRFLIKVYRVQTGEFFFTYIENYTSYEQIPIK